MPAIPDSAAGSASTSAIPSSSYSARNYLQSATAKRKGVNPKVAAAIIAAVVIVGAAGGAAYGMLSSKGDASAPVPADQQDASDESQGADGSQGTGGADGGSSGDSADGSGEAAAPIAVKDSLEEYSWSDLGAIAQEIESATTQEDAMAIAKKYKIVNDAGALTGQTKRLQMTDGSAVDVFVVGILHDQTPSGRKAGLTFMTAACYTTRPMNGVSTNNGGWKGSDMRNWLNSDVEALMPTELQSAIVAVQKQTNNVGATHSTSSVTETTDSLWLFSWRECLGDIAWNVNADTAYIDRIDNREGMQYEWFVQQGVAGVQGHPALVRGVGPQRAESAWWMRSSAPNTSTSFGDMGPALDNGGVASTPEGVVFGFCL